MIITLSGDLGSGKSTVSQMLAEKLNLKRHYAGQIWRDMAEERGMTLYELHEIGDNDPSIDKEVDQRTIDLGKQEDNFIFDSHLAWHFIPNSFKVFLYVEPEEAAKRVLKDLQENEKRVSSEKNYKTFEEAIEGLEKRKQINIKRWEEIYGVNIHGQGNYDLVVDTTNIPAEEVVDEIIAKLPNSDSNN